MLLAASHSVLVRVRAARRVFVQYSRVVPFVGQQIGYVVLDRRFGVLGSGI